MRGSLKRLEKCLELFQFFKLNILIFFKFNIEEDIKKLRFNFS
jgi:hypothetical protein